MTTDITTTTAGTPAEWESAELIQTVRHMYADGATDPEFKIFCEMAKLLGLNPMLKQIWCVKNKNRPDLPAQIYASRDGFLAIAHRSGQFDGMQSGTRKNDEGDEIGWCRIWRKDASHPFEVEILRKEYDTHKNLWESKPQTMTIKVAEAHCLRRAFDIQGVYTPDEMPEPEPMRMVPNTSRPAQGAPMPAQGAAPSAIAEPVNHQAPAKSSSSPRDADAGPVLRCDVCGRSNADYPDLPIRERDGQMICGPCQRKVEKKMHVLSPTEPAPAPTNAVPSAPAKVAAPVASGAVCEDCGKVLQASEEKTSRMFVSRLLCKKCLQHVTGPQPGEERAA